MRSAVVTVPNRSVLLVLALALALWIASTLGLVHRTVHVPGMAGVSQGRAAAVPHAEADARLAGPVAPRDLRGIAVLFGDHHNDADCRLYDQLAHGSVAPSVPFVALPVLLPAATFAWLEGEVLARWVALFDARGPPSSR